jgi:hypothetical protein
MDELGSEAFNRNFRFDSPTSTRLLDPTASLRTVLARFRSTVLPAAPRGWDWRLAAMQRPEMPFVQSIPQTPLPSHRSGHQNLPRSPGRLSRWHPQCHNPLQHAAK